MKKTEHKVRRILLGILAGIVGIVILWLMIHGIYSMYESKTYKKPGTMIETKNGNLHLYADIKDNSNPVYVFIDAFGGPSTYYDFKMLWEPLSDDSSVVTIDYLGYGMSDKTNAERTMENIVEELNEGLKNAGIPEPYIFVSHSLGGFYATGYAIQYPEKVDSLIFIDNTPPALTLEDSSELQMMREMKRKVAFLRFTGLMRFMEKDEAPGLDHKEQKARKYYNNKMLLNKTMVNEIDHTVENAVYLVDKQVPDSIPMLILVSKKNDDMSQDLGWSQTWREYHEEYLNENPKSRLYMIDTGHYIHFEAAGEVVAAIREFAE